MNPEWSRLVAVIVNSEAMRGKPMVFRAEFVRASAKVESLNELPEPWRSFAKDATA